MFHINTPSLKTLYYSKFINITCINCNVTWLSNVVIAEVKNFTLINNYKKS